MSDPYLPEPMTEHPRYTLMAPALRKALEIGRSEINVLEPILDRTFLTKENAESKDILDAPSRRLTLRAKDYIGPAPATIDARWEEAYYTWRAFVDDLGRHVGGPARLDISMRTSRSKGGGSSRPKT